MKFITYYSEWLRLRKTAAWMLKIKATLRGACKEKEKKPAHGKGKRNDKHLLSVEDMQVDKNAIIQFCQSTDYKEEMESLRKGMSVKKSSHIHKLTPVLQDELIRVGGRLVKSAFPHEAKHPAILPRNHHVTTLIIRHVHETIGHSGWNQTLSRLRQRYWIPKANSVVRAVITKCFHCRRLSGVRGSQYMSDFFWKRWTREYLPELQERQKWTKKRRNFVAGDIVLIIDDTAPRNSWVMGRITQTLPDKRGFVRQVQVLTKTSTLTRPITKLALLLEAPERRSLSLSLSPSIFIFISLYLSLSPILIYICVHYIQHGLRELFFCVFWKKIFDF